MVPNILKEAIRIGDDLLCDLKEDEHGLYSETVQEGGQSYGKSENIYLGVSGIVLFLIELYKHTKQERYLSAITNLSRWVTNYSKSNTTYNYSFLTGRLGVSYTLLQVFDLTKKNEYLRDALELSRNCEQFINAYNDKKVNDFLVGISGSIIPLMHLYIASKEIWLIEKINLYVAALLDRIHFGAIGFYWDKDRKNTKPLCGFSHGVSGIGYVFLELGYFFQNPTFYWISDQAFKYESYYYDSSKKNWPDFRKGYSDSRFENNKQLMQEVGKQKFNEANYMTAWCHGAPGIGLTRLRAYELTNDNSYLTDLHLALECTKEDLRNGENNTYTLCHGLGGNANLFIEANRVLVDSDLLVISRQIALDAIKCKQTVNKYYSGYSKIDIEDTSLFMGDAGIGYYYIQVTDPEGTPSILMPRLKERSGVNLSFQNYSSEFAISISELKKRLFMKLFPRTLALIKCYSEDLYENSFFKENKICITNDPFIKCCKLHLEQIILLVPQESMRLQLYDIWELESKIVEADSSIVSYYALELQNSINADKEKLIVGSLLESYSESILKLRDDILIVKNFWKWPLSSSDIAIQTEDRGGFYTAIVPEVKSTKEYRLTHFSYLILSSFLEERSISKMLSLLRGNFELSDLKDEFAFREKVEMQLRLAIQNHFLVII
ncbi:MAG: hypothetical protein HYR67_02965 [Bacteroidetes bacterium]|nr:hypothetical protein [Bacteroidota bacterium]